jgi:CBS domain containing-hemolysin-like protein
MSTNIAPQPVEANDGKEEAIPPEGRSRKNGDHPSLFKGLKDWVKDSLGMRGREHFRAVVEEVLDDNEDDPALSAEERGMFLNLLNFGELNVDDIMVNRTDIVAVPSDTSLENLRQTIITSAHSRVLVYENTLDTIIGMVHAKDLVQFLNQEYGFTLHKVLRPVFAVPPSMRAINLLANMRSNGMHLAVVVDEYGGTDGIVTLEDVFERIVGDIQDEHDEGEEKDESFVWISPREALADAKIEMELLEEHVKTTLRRDGDEEQFDTLGGFLMQQFGHVPAKGEKLTARDIVFEVTEADARRIVEVRITLPEEPA